jgi:hypothetical protein
MANGHGGTRQGSGRKPPPREPAEAIVDAEQRIAQRLPALIDRLFALAEAETPNFRALKYLVDRVMGRPVTANDLLPTTACTDAELIERTKEALAAMLSASAHEPQTDSARPVPTDDCPV